MKEWFTVSDLVGLPGMPATDRGVQMRAKSQEWTRRKRQGRGGGWEYHLGALPPETRAWLAAEGISAVRSEPAAREGAATGRRLSVTAAIEARAEAAARERGLAKLVTLPKQAQRRADAKLEILTALELYAQRAQLTPGKAMVAFCSLYNAGKMEVESWVRDVIADVHPATVYRWRGKLKTAGAASLAGEYGSRRGSSKIDSQAPLKTFVVAMLTEHQHASAAHIYEAIKTRFAGTEIELPSKRGVERWLTTWKAENKQLFEALSNPDAFKNKYMSAFGSMSEDVLHFNQRWELDSTPADLELTDGRHTLLGVIDVHTRMPKLLVAKTSTAAAVAALIRRTILDWGVPEQVKTDNGSDYTSHHIKRVFLALGVEQRLCAPFSGWQKPHIERFFRTFSHDLVELMPGYIGHNVAERKELEARKSFAERLFKKGETVGIRMTASELQAFCDQWIKEIYQHREHAELGGRTPFELVAAAPRRTVADERALDVLLAPAPGDGMRVVTKKGIKVDGFCYIAPELGEHIGERVHVRHDETDLGRVYVFGGGDGGFICVAEDPRYTGISRKDVAVESKRRQTARIQEARKALKAAARKENVRDIAAQMLAAKSEASESLVAFPPRTTPHTSDGLAAAAAAVDAIDRQTKPIEPAPVDEAALARVTQLMRQEQQVEEDEESRFRRWIALQGRAQLSEIEERWLRQYETTSEFRARKLIYDDWGAEAFGVR